MTMGVSKKQGTVVFVVLILVVGFLAVAIRTPTGMEGVRVAVYNDHGVLSHSATALLNMFRWMNAETNYINSTEIQRGALDEYDIVAFPGGLPMIILSLLGL